MCNPDFDSDILFPDHTGAWSKGRRDRIMSGRPWESDVSAMLGALDGEAGHDAVGYILDAVRILPDKEWTYEMVSIFDLAAQEAIKPVGTKQPDFAVWRKRGPEGGRLYEPVVFVELKFGAAVNGGIGYCPTGVHAPYSSQLVCYISECWIAEPTNAVYLWLSPGGNLGTCLDPKHIADYWQEIQENFDQLIGWQNSCCGNWKLAAWEPLAATLGDHGVPGIR